MLFLWYCACGPLPLLFLLKFTSNLKAWSKLHNASKVSLCFLTAFLSSLHYPSLNTDPWRTILTSTWFNTQHKFTITHFPPLWWPSCASQIVANKGWGNYTRKTKKKKKSQFYLWIIYEYSLPQPLASEVPTLEPSNLVVPAFRD